MSKQIRVDDKVYEELDNLRQKHETFSQVIASLISTRVTIFEFINNLEGMVKYNEWRANRLQALEKAIAERDSAPVRQL
jgi:predicted CopG family antitoxin